MEISDKDREIYNEYQKKFSEAVNKFKDSEDGNEIQVYLKNLLEDVKFSGLDFSKFMTLCTTDPNSVLKIMPQNSIQPIQPIQDGPKAEIVTQINTTRKSSEIEGVPDAVCVYRNI